MPKTVCGEAKGNSIVATRVATLTRRSLDRKHQPFSIEAQDAKLGAYIASQDHWELAPGCRYTDDMSGATVERPGLQKALRDAKLGRYDVLLVYRIDRIARSLRGLLEVLDELERAGVAFRSVTEHFDTQSPVGRMLIQILGAFAEFERATIIDRVIAGMERKAARGGWCGGTRPFGYQVDPATHFLVPDPTEGPLVAVIFDLYANQRLGARAIAMQLNAQGHRSRMGRLWGHTTVLTVLRNRAYLGELHFRGAYHPAPHPPLVDRAVFDTAQALLEERGEAHSKRASNSSEYLLAGRVVCQQCGKHFVGNAATGNRYRYRYYTCYSRLRYGTRACSSERLPAEQLDHAVLDALLAAYQHSDLFERAVTAADRQAASLHEHYQGELAVVTTEIGKAAIERYLDAFEAGTLPENAVWQAAGDPRRQDRRPARPPGRAPRAARNRPGPPAHPRRPGSAHPAAPRHDPGWPCPGPQGAHRRAGPRGSGDQPRGHHPGVPGPRRATTARQGSRNVQLGAPGRTRTCGTWFRNKGKHFSCPSVRTLVAVVAP
jgi:site-specific DNA recombinase